MVRPVVMEATSSGRDNFAWPDQAPEAEKAAKAALSLITLRRPAESIALVWALWLASCALMSPIWIVWV